MQGHLDAALRATSAATDDPDILKRVDVRLQRTMDGDRGWDVFSLQYHIKGPMAAVFSHDNMSGECNFVPGFWKKPCRKKFTCRQHN